jgi:hypothetical protein
METVHVIMPLNISQHIPVVIHCADDAYKFGFQD